MQTRLRDWRTAHGVTLEELAGVTGYSVPMLSRVERGERQLSALARIRLARQIGAKVSDIFLPVEPDIELAAEAAAGGAGDL